MQNQMMPKINLMQLPDPAAQTAKYVNMMNATKQQEAAQRQADIAQKRLTIDEAEEKRAVQAHGPAMTKAQQDNIVQALDLFREAVSDIAEGDVAAAEAVRAELVSRVPGYDKFVRPATEWTPAYKNQLKLTAQKEIEKTIATPVASLELDTKGNPRSVTVGGLNPQQSPVYDAPETPMMTPRTPTAPAAPPPANPFAPGYKPNAAAAAPNSLPLVIDSALQTGVMAQADYDKILSNMAPQSRPKIEAWARQNNIQIVPNAPNLTDNQMRGAPADFAGAMRASPMAYDGQTPQSQFANLPPQRMQSQNAGLRGAPPMEQTMAQTQPRTITQLQQRNPNVSPLPGSSQVPLPRVAAEARAGRESPAEAAAKATATARATATVEAEKKAAEKLPGRQQVSTLINKVRAAYEQLERQQAIASEKRGGFANVMDYLGTSSPGREVQKALGTKSSKYLSEITNSRKLLATAIKNATGMSAQEMNSNVELQLTLDALTDPTQGIEAARSTLNTLEELYGAPRTATPTAARPRGAAPKTPVIPDAAKQMLRKNPTPTQRGYFDRTFGKGAAAKVLGGR